MASLDHENVVKVYDICQNEERPFIVAECIGGRNLASMLKRGSGLDERFVRKVAVQLLRALSYAHRRGVIHRDVKPSNILIAPGGTVKVADFGIARIIEEDGKVEEDGEIVGSARYMSPEQLQGEEATPRSDIYSVGVLLYSCLTGEAPFSGNMRTLARRHIHEEPTPPRRLNHGISKRMEEVILTALSKDPEDRYPSAAAMLGDIKRIEDAAESSPNALSHRRRVRNLAATALTILLVSSGTVLGAAGLGYVDLPLVNGFDRAVNSAEPVNGQPVEPPDQPAGATVPSTEASAEESTSQPAGTPEPTSQTVPQPGTAGTGGRTEEQTSVEMVPVPDVRVYFDYAAREILQNEGFEVEVVYAYQEGYSDRGVTWRTDPSIGTLAPAGSTITVYATPLDTPQPQLG